MRILIADDHDLVRETIAAFLESEGISDVVSVEDLNGAVRAVQATGSFDLVLFDLNMAGMNGLEGLSRMIELNESRPVALISGDSSSRVAKKAIEAGAAGFIPKTLGAKSMASALKYMASGETFLPYEHLKEAEAKTVGNLTERETDVLRGLYDGLSNKEIARELDLQEVTIKLHVKTLCRKLGARNRTQAAMIARDKKIL